MQQLPKWIVKFIQSFCPQHLYEEIEGDLLQKFKRDSKILGPWKAKRLLIWNALCFFRPAIFLRNRFRIHLNNFAMLSHFLKVFLRNSLKRKSHSFTTLGGLVLGMTAFILIGLYVWHERSYDNFHAKKETIFRLRQDRYTNGVISRQWTAGPWGIGVDLKRDFPEVVKHVSVNRGGARSTVLSNGSLFFREERVFYASEDFFELFTFPLVKGVDSLVLRRPFTMVISESMAKRYFGNVDPVGKTLKNNGEHEYEITGIFKDVPDNTHLRFDALFSFESLLKTLGPEEVQDLMTNWMWAGNYTYIELSPTADAKIFEAKLPEYVDKKVGALLKSWGEGMAFVLQPVPTIHLYSSHKDELEANGDGRSVQFLMIIAIFILAMAWINYINLVTARSLERAKEVGIRKVFGSHRIQLVRQFLLESFFMKLIALGMTALIVVLILPYYSDFVSRRIDLSAFAIPEVWTYVALIFVSGVVISGLYPAFALSGFKPVSVLKGRFKSSFQGIFLRKGLVTFQFVTSIVLLIFTFVVYRQIQGMRDSSLGVDTESILVMQGPHIKTTNYNANFEEFRGGLLAQSAIGGMTVSSDIPGRPVRGSNGGVRLEGENETKGNSFRVLMSDEGFRDTYSLELLAGRWFSKEFKDKWKTVLVNETAMHLLGINEPEKLLGKKIYLWGDLLEVVGVVKDYHQESLKKKVDQLIFVCDDEISDYYSVKIKNNKALVDVVAEVEKRYKESFSGNPFHYFFIDDFFNQQYQSDRQFGKVFGLFTVMAITIACLGLFGLSSYLVTQRTREIGIRKILGASVEQLALLVSREFTLVMMLAALLSLPVSYFAAKQWLSEFAYKIDLDSILFAAPAILVFLIAIVTVAGQSIHAARTNPVDTLKTE